MATERTWTLEDLPEVIRDRVRVVQSGCWEWVGSRTTKGYGRAYLRNRAIPIHRAVARHCGILVTKGALVCHKCDHPPCCNPAHLFEGFHRDNIADSMRKGRAHYLARTLDHHDGKIIAARMATESATAIGRSMGVGFHAVYRCLNAYLDTLTRSVA